MINSKNYSKGDRLKWKSLKDAKSVKLTAELISGKVIDFNELSKRNNNIVSNILVP
jgi:hypothetical protein